MPANAATAAADDQAYAFYSVIHYAGGGDLLNDARTIIDGARKYAYSAVNVALVQRNWLLGKRICEEILKGDNRAEYGAEVIVRLAKELKAEYGDGFTKTNLYNFTEFYKAFPEIFHEVSGKFNIRLSWTHYRVLLQVNDSKARDSVLHGNEQLFASKYKLPRPRD